MPSLTADDVRALNAEVAERRVSLQSWAALEALPLAQKAVRLAKESCDFKEMRYWYEALVQTAGMKVEKEQAQQAALPILHFTFVNGNLHAEARAQPMDVEAREVVPDGLPLLESAPGGAPLPPLRAQDMPDVSDMLPDRGEGGA